MDIQELRPREGIRDIKDIDDSPGPFCMSFGFNLGPLINSIKNVGMINPPLLIRDKGGGYSVIAGYRRVLALKALRYEKTPCLLLSESRISPLECLLVSLYDNLATRRFNEVEKGMALSRLTSVLSLEEVSKNFMPLLDLPSHQETLQFYVKLEGELEDEPKLSLASGHISLRTASRLLEIKSEARSRVFHWISNLRLNINQQIQFIDYLVDLSHIKRMSISDFLEEYPLENIFPQGDMNRPQRAKAILRFLRGMRLPTVVSAEEDFRKDVLRLQLPEGVKITASPYFESPYYRLEILFREGKELREKIGYLWDKDELEGLANFMRKKD
jgi:hypothetical protein